MFGVLAWAPVHSAVPQRPDPQAARQLSTLVLSGVVTAVDKGTYQEHAFEVPAGVSRLDFEFTHSHPTDGTQLEVGVFDPSGFRGASRFSKRRFHIAEAHATPSYVPGRLPAGRWRVSLGIPAVFLFGGMKRADKPERVELRHGDVAVWGGPARLRYHGVMPLKEGHHPLVGRHRINLTFRKAG